MIDVEALLAPAVEDPPCGPDLEYDPAFMELEQAARGKPEQQFGDTLIPAEEPAWGDIRTSAVALLGRSKDLRVAALLARALVRTANFAGFLPGMQLIREMLERYWDGVHPRLDPEDANDPTMRMNALAPLVDIEAMLRDLRDACLVDSRHHGTVMIRDIETALGKLPAREGVEQPSLAQIQSILNTVLAEDAGLASSVEQSLAVTTQLSALLAEKVGTERAPDFKPLLATLRSIQQALPASAAPPAAAEEPSLGIGGVAAPISGEIRTRQDALLMIDKIVLYFERNEPTNPAPLLLKRAKRLMNMSFVDIIRDMVPDSMHQIETIAGLGREE